MRYPHVPAGTVANEHRENANDVKAFMRKGASHCFVEVGFLGMDGIVIDREIKRCRIRLPILPVLLNKVEHFGL